MRRKNSRTTTVQLAGIVAQGKRVTKADEEITLPADKIDKREIVFRFVGSAAGFGVDDGDLLIVERRRDGHAATGELVIALLHERAFLGRWWAKRGARTLLDADFQTIVDAPELTVFGAVTLIARVQAE